MTAKVFLCSTFGLCESHSYLTTRLYNFLNENHIDIVNKSNLADIIIINTCAFDNEREGRAKNIINHYMRNFLHKKKIIIIGCLTKIDPEFVDQDGLITVSNSELNKLDALFDVKISIDKIKANVLNKNCISDDYGFQDDYYVQISEGCLFNCSYCAIKRAKGNPKSKPIIEIIKEIQVGIGLGFKRFVLLSDDCGSYGADIDVDFADLLNDIYLLDKEIAFNIHYLNPAKLIELFPKINKNVWKKIYFANIPFQTVSARILKLMNRDYDIDEVLKLIKKIRKINKNIFLDTHILYCFPSESREEFIETFRLRDYFDRVIYFYYTDKKNTVASKMDNKISQCEMMYRTSLILKMNKEDDRILPGYDNREGGLYHSIRTNNFNEYFDILLIYPKSAEDKLLGQPLSLLSIAAPLIEDGFNVKILDERLEDDIEKKIEKLLKKNPLLLVGFSFYTGAQIENVIKMSGFVRKYSEIPIVVGGPHVTILPEQTLKSGFFDIVVRGEGEETILKLLQNLKENKSIEKVPGISYLDKDKPEKCKIIHNPDALPIDLEKLPSLPLFLLIEYLEKYDTNLVQSSRGCPYSCSYCIIPAINKTYRTRSIRDIISEIQQILGLVTHDNIVFIDDNFFVNLKRVKKFAKLLAEKIEKKEISNFSWWAECRADTVLKINKRLMDLLIKSGLDTLYIGAESGSDKTLERINKGITTEIVAKANKFLSEFDLNVEYTFMIDFPFETKEDIDKTFAFAKELKDDNPNATIWEINSYTPYPGTSLFKEFQDEIKLPKNFEDWSSFDWYRKDVRDVEFKRRLR